MEAIMAPQGHLILTTMGLNTNGVFQVLGTLDCNTKDDHTPVEEEVQLISPRKQLVNCTDD